VGLTRLEVLLYGTFALAVTALYWAWSLQLVRIDEQFLLASLALLCVLLFGIVRIERRVRTGYWAQPVGEAGGRRISEAAVSAWCVFVSLVFLLAGAAVWGRSPWLSATIAALFLLGLVAGIALSKSSRLGDVRSAGITWTLAAICAACVVTLSAPSGSA
jgi:hypothetical protein